MYSFFFFNDTATTEIYTLSLHDALPICTAPTLRCPDARGAGVALPGEVDAGRAGRRARDRRGPHPGRPRVGRRSEEHTSELQSRQYLVCRLLLEKKKTSLNS